MAGSVNTVWTKNPTGAAALLYSRTRVERAPDVAGAPGAFVEIADILIDTTDEFTAYLDTAGEDTSWYRYRWADALGATFSGYTDAGQVGDNKVKTWAMRNMPDADLLDPFWDQWIEEILVDCFSRGIWKEDYADIVPTTTNNRVDFDYGLPAKIRDVIRVETLYDGVPSHEGDPTSWDARGRRIYLYGLNTSQTVRVWGKCRFNAVGEMTDDFFELLHEMLRMKYYDFRANGRGNYRAYIVLDRNADISPEQLQKFHDMAERNVNRQVAALSFGEPAIQVPQGGYSHP